MIDTLYIVAGVVLFAAPEICVIIAALVKED